MQPFTCPQCSHKSRFDPWTESAHCPQCGFAPPTGVTKHSYVQWAQRHAYQPFLDELISHWNRSHTPDPSFTLESPLDALDFFADYRQALGEDPHALPGTHVQYVRDYEPTHREILIFAGAYLRLRRGDHVQAVQDLEALTFTSPQFIDPWVWLSATTDDADERRKYLDKATYLDAGHPLARDALVIVQGKVPIKQEQRGEQIVVTQCPQCGGGLRYEPGMTEVNCPYCGHQVTLQQTNVVDGEATALHDLRLKRRYQGHSWAEAHRAVHCRTCGVQLTMTYRLAQHCAFCGSTNVLVKDNRWELEQPDGLLPFKIGREQAGAAIQQAQRSGWRRLKSWWNEKQQTVQDLEGLYFPFWVFDGIVETYNQQKTWSTTEKQTQRWDSLENMPFPGVDAPAPTLLQKVYPFDLSTLVPYEPQILADWPARLYNRDVEIVVEEARTAMLAQIRRRSRKHAAPAGNSQGFQIVGTTYQLVLLPVWVGILAGEEGKHGLALVNGQTGKVAFGPRHDG